MFLNPRMSDEETRLYYRGAYRNKVSGAGGILQSDLINQHKRAVIQVGRCAKFLKGITSCLEIGASAGYLMHELATTRAIRCTGIEPDGRYHSIDPARRYPMYHDISDIPQAHYDLFALSHSLEHLNHPLEYLRNLRDNYSNGNALFLIEVPNYAVYVNTLSPHHPFAYSIKTLDRLFERLGYVQIMNTTHNLELNGAHRFLIAIYGADNG